MLMNNATQCFVDVGNSTRQSLPSVEDTTRISQSAVWSEGHRF